jgi:ppGpp synthetase/RelA/SpoT-type nucleotidyltranferase
MVTGTAVPAAADTGRERAVVPLSKSQVNNAGFVLVASENIESPTVAAQSRIVDEWRALHGVLMYWMAESVRGRLSRLLRHVAVGQRLKRKHQIVAKLRRESIKLARMQDVGGCRAVIESAPEVILAADRIKRSGPYYKIIRQSDYRDQGRADTGYRALHVIALRDGHQIEIQLRTVRQQAWAEAVERAANRSGFDLKSGSGPADMIEFFQLASDALYKLDAGKTVSSAMRRKLRELRAIVDEYMLRSTRAGAPRRHACGAGSSAAGSTTG